MESVQVRLTKEQIRALDRLVSAQLFSSRNEAVREAVRRLTVEYMQIAGFKWPLFGPRSQEETEKIIESSKDAEKINVPAETIAILERLI